MPQNINHIFPQDFLQKLINFPKERLANLFKLSQEAVHRFIRKELHALDPLVCENACHIRAFALWHITHKYKHKKSCLVWYSVQQALNEIIHKINSLPPINEQAEQTIENYLQKNRLYLELDNDLIFDIKFIFLSHLLTRTKKQLPSSSFMLHEKTCMKSLNDLGLVHNKVKNLISSAQKELSSMSCEFVQKQSVLCNNKSLKHLLVTRYDDHNRSYLPQYSTAKVMFLNSLQNNIPIIIKVSRFVQQRYHDELFLGFKASPNKKDFYPTQCLDDEAQAAIVCKGIIHYPERAEQQEAYLNRLNEHSLMQILLANFAAHPQFSGNLRQTPCVYKEALENTQKFKADIAQEWEEYSQHVYFAKKEGCALENPKLLFLNHVFCDSVASYPLKEIA